MVCQVSSLGDQKNSNNFSQACIPCNHYCNLITINDVIIISYRDCLFGINFVKASDKYAIYFLNTLQ